MPASTPGAGLGTWIGEEEENQAWDLLRYAREAVDKATIDERARARALEAALTAEGSDWFW